MLGGEAVERSRRLGQLEMRAGERGKPRAPTGVEAGLTRHLQEIPEKQSAKAACPRCEVRFEATIHDLLGERIVDRGLQAALQRRQTTYLTSRAL